jgi:hypothetical protein
MLSEPRLFVSKTKVFETLIYTYISHENVSSVRQWPRFAATFTKHTDGSLRTMRCRPDTAITKTRDVRAVACSELLGCTLTARPSRSATYIRRLSQTHHFSRSREYLYARLMLAGFKDSYRKLETSGSAFEAIHTRSTPRLPRRLKHSFARAVPKPFLL